MEGGCIFLYLISCTPSLLTARITYNFLFLRLTDFGNARSSAAMEYAQRYMRSLQGLHNEENATLDIMCADDEDNSANDGDNSEKTWLDLAKEEVKTRLLCNEESQVTFSKHNSHSQSVVWRRENLGTWLSVTWLHPQAGWRGLGTRLNVALLHSQAGWRGLGMRLNVALVAMMAFSLSNPLHYAGKCHAKNSSAAAIEKHVPIN